MVKFKKNLKQKRAIHEVKNVVSPSISDEVAERTIVNAAKEEAKNRCENFDSVLVELIEKHAEKRVQGPCISNPIFEDIVSNVLMSLTDEEKSDWINQDNVLKGYGIDLKKAIKGKKMLTAAIINRQIEARTQEVLIHLAEKHLYKELNDGNIIDRFNDEYKKKYRVARDCYTIAMDIVDSALKDFADTIHYFGMSGDVNILIKVEEARKAISEWYSNGMKCYTDEDREATELEAENIYQYIREKRLPILLRKIDKNKKNNSNDSSKTTTGA